MEEEKVDAVLNVVNDINDKLSKLELKPKKESKKLPQDFDYSLIDTFILNYFENSSAKKIKLNQLFESFKTSYSKEELKLIPSLKYNFDKRVKNLCETSIVVYKLKQ